MQAVVVLLVELGLVVVLVEVAEVTGGPTDLHCPPKQYAGFVFNVQVV